MNPVVTVARQRRGILMALVAGLIGGSMVTAAGARASALLAAKGRRAKRPPAAARTATIRPRAHNNDELEPPLQSVAPERPDVRKKGTKRAKKQHRDGRPPKQSSAMRTPKELK